jgi:hypothetical protein
MEVKPSYPERPRVRQPPQSKQLELWGSGELPLTFWKQPELVDRLEHETVCDNQTRVKQPT